VLRPWVEQLSIRWRNTHLLVDGICCCTVHCGCFTACLAIFKLPR
jgi:hypothetical protein